jgi:hypothetical protein
MTMSVTLTKLPTNSPSLENPIGIGKRAADDDHDAHDDELQKSSKGGVALTFADTRDHH